jgi:histidyl-tRNA synthetase
MPYRAAKGMNDILPEDIRRWHAVESAFRRLVELHGFNEVRTPYLEPTELFVRSVGETTDIVQKEMFTFQHHSDSLSLRPEGTASAVRAYVQHTVHAREPVSRWYYMGPMFRAERPQRGRYRQFFQAGCEVFGDAGPACDAELLEMLTRLFQGIGIADVEVCINSLGSAGTRQRHRDALTAFLTPRAAELSEASQRRLEDNPLRILDSKHPADQEISKGAPSVLDLLEGEDLEHWNELRAQLTALGVPFVVDPSLVRGLDYYTRTAFEIRSTSGNLGAQNAICGGGRYDEMVADLGGPSVPAFGFAMGLERVLLAMTAAPERPQPSCYLAPMGARATREALVIARDLRAMGHPAELDGRGGSLKSMLRRASGRGATVCLVLGDAELDRSVVQVKLLDAHQQEDVARDQVVARVAEELSRTAAGSSA